MNFKISLVLILFSVMTWSEEEKEVELPYRAESALRTFDRKVEGLKEKYVKEYDKLLEDAVEDLEEAKRTEMKRGNLDEAVAVQAKIDEINNSVKRDMLGKIIVAEEDEEDEIIFKPGKYLSTSITTGYIAFWTVKKDGTGKVKNIHIDLTYDKKTKELRTDYTPGGAAVYKYDAEKKAWIGEVTEGDYKGHKVKLEYVPE